LRAPQESHYNREGLSETAAVQKPIQDPGATEEYPTALAARVASRFDAPRPLEALEFPEKGNINHHTFIVSAGKREGAREYLLQRINQQVFTRPDNVMAAMMASIDAQRRTLERRPLPDGRTWETITLVPTREGAPYLVSRQRRGTTWWRMMVKIPACRTYKSLGEIAEAGERLRIAEEAGRGLAIYGDLTACMDISNLKSPLPGYRDTRVYYDQFNSVLAENRTYEAAGELLPEDEALLHSTREHFLVHCSPREYKRRREDPAVRRSIEIARREEDFGMTLLREMAAGRIRRVGIHGDTKLDNFLFDSGTGRVKALIDLDTIMPHSWLADWGDMVRSLSNIAGEKAADPGAVQVDCEVYRAVARGFLETAREVTPAEVALMPQAVEIIALELGVRFLADYIRGDSYFKLGPADPPDLNRTRALVQLTLFERLRERRDEMRRTVESFSSPSREAGGT
jgi:hypothetical protein